MSYVEVPVVLQDTKMFTISFWWRVPQRTLDLAISEADSSTSDSPPLTGIIPLVVFGGVRRGRKNEVARRTLGATPGRRTMRWDCHTCTWVPERPGDPPSPPVPIERFYETGFGEKFDILPSYIGVDCSDLTPRFSVHLVMPDKEPFEITSGAVPTSFTSSVQGDVYPEYLSDTLCAEDGGCEGAAGIGNHPIDGIYNGDEDDGGMTIGCAPGILAFNTITFTGVSSPAVYADKTIPQIFRTLPGGFGYINPDAHLGTPVGGGRPVGVPPYGQEVTGDRWHHTIVAVDLSNPVKTKGSHRVFNQFGHSPSVTTGTEATVETEGKRVSSACRMFISYDDRNLVKKNLSAFWPTGYKDPNGITTQLGLRVAEYTTDTSTVAADNCFGSIISRVAKVDYTPSYSYEPTVFSFGDKISFPADSGHFQQVKEIELGDCYIYNGIALDTTAESARRAFISKRGRPVSPSKIKKFFGRKADFIMRGVGNWQEGINTGLTATEPPTPGSPVGQIDPYVPSPNLYGDQGT